MAGILPFNLIEPQRLQHLLTSSGVLRVSALGNPELKISETKLRQFRAASALHATKTLAHR